MRMKGYRDAYISRILSVGRSALRWAWKRGELASVPFILDVPRDLDVEAERFRNLDMEEVARLLSASSQSPHLLKFCIFSLNTLARPEAILELKPMQVDLSRRLLSLNPKGRKQTKKYRPQIPITDTLLPWLSDAGEMHFILYRGEPIRALKKSFKRTVERAGLVDVVPYCLRHTMATELRARNVPEWEVAGMLGHRKSGL